MNPTRRNVLAVLQYVNVVMNIYDKYDMTYDKVYDDDNNGQWDIRRHVSAVLQYVKGTNCP